MRPLRSVVGILASVLFLCALASRAQDGLPGALYRSSQGASFVSVFGQELAASDLDNDQKPDGAVLLESGQINGQRDFRIELHVTAGRNATFEFTSRERELSISALDVNGDGAPDIVIEKTFTHERVQTYLNDGHGVFQRTSERFAAPDDPPLQWRTRAASQNLSMDSMSPTRTFELGATRTGIFKRQQGAIDESLRLDGILVQCGVRAPCQSRAPPSLRSL